MPRDGRQGPSENDLHSATREYYGTELILDLHDCNVEKFHRKDIDDYFPRLCRKIGMEKCEVHFWDDVGVPIEERQTSPLTKGTSAVCFILTSTIVVHTLDELGAVYVNIFSCEEFDPVVARKFTDRFTRNYGKLSESILPFADLANLTDLALLAALIGTDRLHEKVGWDLSWAMDPKGYPEARMAVPKGARTLVNYHSAGKMIIFSSGGVRLSPGQDVQKRVRDEKGALKDQRRRPGGGDWILSRKLR